MDVCETMGCQQFGDGALLVVAVFQQQVTARHQEVRRTADDAFQRFEAAAAGGECEARLGGQVATLQEGVVGGDLRRVGDDQVKLEPGGQALVPVRLETLDVGP